MKLTLSSFVTVILLSAATPAQGQTENCSGESVRFGTQLEAGTCLTSWNDGKGLDRIYPDDFEDIRNQVTIYKCPTSQKRVIISNAIPDHDLTQQNDIGPCEFPFAIEMPLDPVYNPSVSKSEVPIRGMIAMAKNGVPAYGPQESDGLNAVEATESNKQGAMYWYGHAGGNAGWHTHNPQMGKPAVTTETFLGYAMDGFPIYGPLSDDAVTALDECNGLLSEDGTYKYHVRTLEQVDASLEYCVSGYSSGDPLINWKYILGCYAGDVTQTEVYDSNEYNLPSDCVEDTEIGDDPTSTPVTPPPTTSPPVPLTRPNIIIMQPDDLPFLDEWSPPPNNPATSNSNNAIPPAGMPNIESLRTGGLWMKQAYTASPMCGTSRFSTMTGRMPARALSVRDNFDSHPSGIRIPVTKLEREDCTRDNLAQAFKAEGYATAMVGKWHLSAISRDDYNHEAAMDVVEGCGFDTVGGLYIENLKTSESGFNSYSDGTFSHNQEWLTYDAIKFINETTSQPEPQPFFLYFNPTVPHSSNDVKLALTDFSCKDTAGGTLAEEPWIKGMSEDEGCVAYRQTVIDRSNGVDEDLGKIWLDDSVGALIDALKDNGVYENTIFLFQEDHGMDTKGAIYENGIRIPQFVHYPAVIPAGSVLDVPVSTVDIAATMLDYAGVETLPYEMDGKSWKEVIGRADMQSYWKNDRCLFFEIGQDRAARCGCYKYLDIFAARGNTYNRGVNAGLATDIGGMLFDLCDGTEDYITTRTSNNREENTVSNASAEAAVTGNLDCYMDNTDPGATAVYGTCGPAEPSFTDPPTPAPTAPPTANPTANPTASPTANPTKNPTASPTANPTANPTVPSTPRPTKRKKTKVNKKKKVFKKNRSIIVRQRRKE